MKDAAENFSEQNLIPLLCVVGPTAVGKTETAIELARKLGGEIISADSVQVYRYMDIGTAKPTIEERKGVPHHMIDIVKPDINFTVYDYQKKAQNHINKIHNKGKLPILTGGTGLYIKAVIDQYTFRGGKANVSVRKRLQKKLELKGKEHLYRLLQTIDPAAAKRVHPNDSRRVIRALEFFHSTGEPISTQWKHTKKKQSNYKLIMIGLTMNKKNLYEKINRRVDLMIKKGLLQEVEGLLEKGYKTTLKSMQSLGYSHFARFLKGEHDWETAVTTLKRDTRRYAKRQLTWFRPDSRISWYERKPNDMKVDPILDNICYKIEGYC
ncbi:MAG: tRNA (adenosine(37)-N6)-dimethylallyltransferase MiaA [Firmicutes bacterium]|nr:tRNA (adenosine(37)-N6)-dimethylallyltransferase MiaA [Bacillota bacterium]